MALLPTGTVTFLYTDIEGSTKLARNFPDAWPMIQARHHALLETAITTQHGYIFQTIGDEFHAAFETALEALAAALAAQHCLACRRLGGDWIAPRAHGPAYRACQRPVPAITRVT